MINALSVDVEEYFHPSEVQPFVDCSSWRLLPSRVGPQIGRILRLLEKYNTKATFFILGWVAENHPSVVSEIVSRGHEIGCHSYSHRLVYKLSPGEFREDTRRAVAAVEQACGVTPLAYRAPSYSITADSLWALDILVQLGFQYDSSIYPISHDRYGIPGFSRHAVTQRTPSGRIIEIPVGTVKLGADTVAPIGGGGYLRLLPYCYTAAGIRRVNEIERRPVCMYFHPWEIDPDLPRIAEGAVARFRTYAGLRRMESKIERLLSSFEFSTISAVYGGTLMASRANGLRDWKTLDN